MKGIKKYIWGWCCFSCNLNYIVLFFFFTKFSITKLLIKSNTSAQPQVQPSATEGALALKALKAAPLPALHECCVTSDGIVQAQLNL